MEFDAKLQYIQSLARGVPIFVSTARDIYGKLLEHRTTALLI